MDGLTGSGGSADPYAIVLFEDAAARSHVQPRSRAPKWPCSVPRAFVFDVTRPYSCCYVALKDSDDASADDDIGRVVIELSALTSGVVYDCWFEAERHTRRSRPSVHSVRSAPLKLLHCGCCRFELLRKTYRHSRGRRGLLRLRYSVTFRSGRERLLRHVTEPHAHMLRCRCAFGAPCTTQATAWCACAAGTSARAVAARSTRCRPL